LCWFVRSAGVQDFCCEYHAITTSQSMAFPQHTGLFCSRVHPCLISFSVESRNSLLFLTVEDAKERYENIDFCVLSDILVPSVHISSRTGLGTVPMDNSSAADKYRIVTPPFSTTTLAYTFFLDVLGRAVQSSLWTSVSPFSNSAPFSDMLHSYYTFHIHFV
jgi:hypothetical protein